MNMKNESTLRTLFTKNMTNHIYLLEYCLPTLLLDLSVIQKQSIRLFCCYFIAIYAI